MKNKQYEHTNCDWKLYELVDTNKWNLITACGKSVLVTRNNKYWPLYQKTLIPVKTGEY